MRDQQSPNKELEEAIVSRWTLKNVMCVISTGLWISHIWIKGLLYKTTGVVIRLSRLGHCWKTANRRQEPIHIAYLQSLTEDLARRLLRKKRPAGHDNDAGGVALTVAREITPPAELEASSGSEISPSNVLEKAERAENDAVNAGRHVCEDEENSH